MIIWMVRVFVVEVVRMWVSVKKPTEVAVGMNIESKMMMMTTLNIEDAIITPLFFPL